MNRFEQANQFKREFLDKHPHLKEEVEDFYQLMLDECEDECTSTQNEIDLFIGACEDLLIEDE